MNDLKIKFSHDSYLKFEMKEAIIENGDIVELIGVSVCPIEKLSKSFLEYDTNYGTETEPEYFELPKKGMFLVLFFFDGSDIFSTIRRHTEQKMEYYCGNIGKEFIVIIEPEKEVVKK
jgi:hypothetical protein